jgi:hypothetical protein
MCNKQEWKRQRWENQHSTLFFCYYFPWLKCSWLFPCFFLKDCVSCQNHQPFHLKSYFGPLFHVQFQMPAINRKQVRYHKTRNQKNRIGSNLHFSVLILFQLVPGQDVHFALPPNHLERDLNKNFHESGTRIEKTSARQDELLNQYVYVVKYIKFYTHGGVSPLVVFFPMRNFWVCTLRWILIIK